MASRGASYYRRVETFIQARNGDEIERRPHEALPWGPMPACGLTCRPSTGMSASDFMFGTTVGAISQMEFGLCEAIGPNVVCDQLDVFRAMGESW